MPLPRTPVSQPIVSHMDRATRNSGQPLFQGELPGNLPRGRPFTGTEPQRSGDGDSSQASMQGEGVIDPQNPPSAH